VGPRTGKGRNVEEGAHLVDRTPTQRAGNSLRKAVEDHQEEEGEDHFGQPVTVAFLGGDRSEHDCKHL